jgi:hypothetical protein
MKRWIRLYRVEIVIILFCLADFVIENINGRLWMNDFRVYYSAASELIQGHDIYGKPYGLGSGYYKYSPIVAMVFVPFALLPYAIAKCILFLFSAVATVLLFSQFRSSLSGKQSSFYNFNSGPFYADDNNKNRKVHLILYITFVTIVVHLFTEFHLGNVNMILVFLLSSALLLIDRKDIPAGMLIGFCLLVKPHFLILLPLVIFRKKFKTLLSTVITVVAGLLIPALFIGWNQNTSFLGQWINEMKQHSTDLDNAYQTFAFIIQRNIFGGQSTEVYFKIEIAVLIIFVLLFLGFLLQHLKVEREEKRLQSARGTVASHRLNFQSEYVLLLAMVPSLVITDTEHFLFSLPLIFFLLTYAFKIGMNKSIYLYMLILSLLFYGGRWRDLIGLTISDWAFYNGLLGIANVLLMILFVVLFSKLPLVAQPKDVNG